MRTRVREDHGWCQRDVACTASDIGARFRPLQRLNDVLTIIVNIYSCIRSHGCIQKPVSDWSDHCPPYLRSVLSFHTYSLHSLGVDSYSLIALNRRSCVSENIDPSENCTNRSFNHYAIALRDMRLLGCLISTHLLRYLYN